jgi:formaldehyde-activating enzyme involved in methanogenesis
MSELFNAIMESDPKKLFRAIIYPKVIVKPMEFIVKETEVCSECSADLTDGGQHYSCCSRSEE